MLCTVCKKNDATVHLTQVIGDKLEKIDLCESCSQEKGVSDTTGFALAELLLGISGAKDEASPAPSSKTHARCPHCGFTQADLKKTARLGCPECYQVFTEPLAGLLKSMHRGVKHVGKVPRIFRAPKEQAAQLGEIQAELEQAVTNEDFERAAILRDQIKEMKARLSALAAS